MKIPEPFVTLQKEPYQFTSPPYSQLLKNFETFEAYLRDLGPKRDLQPRIVDKGHVLFSAGNVGSFVYGIRQGEVTLSVSSPKGSSLIFGNSNPSQNFLIGLESIDGLPYVSSAKALTLQLSYIAVPSQQLAHFARLDQEFAKALRQIQTINYAAMCKRLADTSFMTIEQRVAQYALAESKSTSSNAIDFNATTIAGYLGVSREMVSRIKRRMEERGLIDFEGKQVTILDKKGLEKIVEQ